MADPITITTPSGRTARVYPGNVYTTLPQGTTASSSSVGTAVEMGRATDKAAGTPTRKVISDGADALMDGAQEAAGRGGYGRIGVGIGVVGAVSDGYNVLQHMVEGRYREAAIEAGSAGGQLGGAWGGAVALSRVVGAIPHPAAKAFGAVGGAIVGSRVGSEAGEEVVRASLAPTPPPNDFDKPPTVELDNTKYYFYEGHWFHEIDRWWQNGFPARFVAIGVDQTRRELTDTYIRARLSPEDYQRYQQDLAEIRQYGDTLVNISERIRPVGNVVVSEEAPSSQAEAPQAPSAVEGLMRGKPFGQWIADDPAHPELGREIWVNGPSGNIVFIRQGGGQVIEMEFSKESGEAIFIRHYNLESGQSNTLLDRRSGGNVPEAPRTDDGGLYVTPTPSAPAAQSMPPSGASDEHSVDTYIVQPGDSLWKISQELGVSLQQLIDANPQLADPDLIHPGQQINLRPGEPSNVIAPVDRSVTSRVDEAGFTYTTDWTGAVNTAGGFYAGDFDDDYAVVGAALYGGQVLFANYAEEIVRTYVDEHGFIDVRVGDTPAQTASEQADVQHSGSGDGDATGLSTRGSATDPAATALGNSLLSAYGVYGALKGGDPLAIARVGVGLADKFQQAGEVSFEALGAPSDPSAAPSTLGQVGLGIGVALGTIGLLRALESDDVIGAVSSGLSAAAQAAQLAGASFAGSLSAVAGPLGMVSAMAAGDPVGAFASALMMTGNPIAIGIGVVISLFGSKLFGEEEPYEAPTGEGHYYRAEGDGIALSVTGQAGNQGDHVRASLGGRFGELEDELSETPTGDELIRVALNRALHHLRDQLPDEAAIIPERLPSLAFNGYFYIATFTDPLTAETRQVAVARPDVVETLQQLAYYSEAIAPTWEAEGVAARLAQGDPHYWYTEAQRASLTPALPREGGGSERDFTPIVIDLDPNGPVAPSPLAGEGRDEGGVFFDVDDDSYKEATQWISAQDAFLALDRNLDGQIDHASELFSNSAVAAAYRGLAGLNWLDVNADGVIDERDPVFTHLQLWQDANRDGVSQAEELTSLREAGITELRYRSADSDAFPLAALTAGGLTYALMNPALAAEDKGIRTEALPGGTLIEEEGGESLFYVSEALDLGPASERRGMLTASLLGERTALLRDLKLATEIAGRQGPFAEASALLFALGFGIGAAPVLAAAAPLPWQGPEGDPGLAEPGLIGEPSAQDGFLAGEGKITNSAPPGVLVPPPDTSPSSSAPSPAAAPPAAGAVTDLPPPPNSGLPLTAAPVSGDALESVLSARAPLGIEQEDGAVSLTPHNQPPLASDDLVAGLEDTVVFIPQSVLLANDLDLEHGPLTITAVDAAEHGTVSLDAAGNIRFTPDADYFGLANFRYTVSDPAGLTTTASAFLAIGPVNDAPRITASTLGTVIYGYAPILGEAAFDQEGNALPREVLGYTPVFNAAEAIFQEDTGGEGGFSRQFIYDAGGGTHDVFFDSGGNLVPLSAGNPGQYTGQVLATDIDDPADALRFSLTAAPLHGTAGIDPLTGAWSYTRTECDPYSGADPFSIAVSDPAGASATVSVAPHHHGFACSDGKKPLVVDLDGDGPEIVGVDDSTVFFDVNADGWREHTAWADKDDALLAFDRDGDGRISDAAEIVFSHYHEDARTDLEGLRAFDSNGDELFSALDERWGDFGLWQDDNQDGITDPGEYRSLDQHGIAKIHLTGTEDPQLYPDGSVRFATTTYVREDGTTGLMGDYRLAYEAGKVKPPAEAQAPPGQPEAAALAEEAELNRLVDQLRADMAAFAPPAPALVVADAATESMSAVLAEESLTPDHDETHAHPWA